MILHHVLHGRNINSPFYIIKRQVTKRCCCCCNFFLFQKRLTARDVFTKVEKNVARNVYFLKSLAYLSALSLNFTFPGSLGGLWGWSWRLLWALGRSLGLLGGTLGSPGRRWKDPPGSLGGPWGWSCSLLWVLGRSLRLPSRHLFLSLHSRAPWEASGGGLGASCGHWIALWVSLGVLWALLGGIGSIPRALWEVAWACQLWMEAQATPKSGNL